jgi:hypothetical protein
LEVASVTASLWDNLSGDPSGESSKDPDSPVSGLLPAYFFSILSRNSTSLPLYFLRRVGTSPILLG